MEPFFIMSATNVSLDFSFDQEQPAVTRDQVTQILHSNYSNWNENVVQRAVFVA
jgi:hypothetical protein